MKFNNLHDVFVEQLKDMYSAEKQLTRALPKMAKSATNPELRKAFEHHLTQTESHLETVQSILNSFDANPTSTMCKAMEGLIEEGNDVASQSGDGDARDAALILAAQKVEHYEIATYGGLRTFAKTLGYTDTAETLQGILNEEYDADQTLDNLAMGLKGEPSLNAAAQS